MTCVHCSREIVLDDDVWVDPEADGDDILWREVCDSHDTFTAEHEPGNSAAFSYRRSLKKTWKKDLTMLLSAPISIVVVNTLYVWLSK